MFAGNVDMCLWRTANDQCSCVGNVGEFLEEKKENRTEGEGGRRGRKRRGVGAGEDDAVLLLTESSAVSNGHY